MAALGEVPDWIGLLAFRLVGALLRGSVLAMEGGGTGRGVRVKWDRVR